MLRGILWIVGSLVVLGLIFGGSDDEGSDQPATDDPVTSEAGPGKFDQTWPSAYSDTTCADWNGRMSSHERFVAAADMLTGARNKGDGGTGLPSDALIEEFEGGITNVCVKPTMTLTDAAVGLYLTEPRFQP